MKTNKMYKRSRLSLLVTGVLGLFTIAYTSCRNDDPVDMNGPGKEITITMSVPGINPADGPVTYAMPTDEAKVNTVDVLCFQTDPAGTADVDRGTFLYRATVGHTAGDNTFKVILAELAVNQTLVVLANCRTQVETLLGTISAGATKASVISSLLLEQSTAFDASTMTGIPMWGEITNQAVTSGYNPIGGLSVNLTRMLARVNITNGEVLFDLTEAYLYNPRQKGSIIPDNWTGTDVTNPTIVAGAQMAQKTRFGPFTTSATNTIDNKIYTFEADNIAKAGTDPLDATCLVVGGYYNGSLTKSYYRVDLKNYTTNAFYDVKRNYSYNVTITKIDLEGPDTPDKAFEGKATIQATVQAWNDRNGSVTAGQSHLYVSRPYLWVKLDGTTEAYAGSKTITIKTDDPSGWHFDTSDATTAATLTWAQPSQSSGAQNSSVNLTFTPNNASAFLEGAAVITTGNLKYTIHFVQDDCGRFGHALPQTMGSNVYLTYRDNYDTGLFRSRVCWTLQNSIEGVPIMTTLQSVEYPFYTASTRVDACPDPWHLMPYATTKWPMPQYTNEILDAGLAAGLSYVDMAGRTFSPAGLVWNYMGWTVWTDAPLADSNDRIIQSNTVPGTYYSSSATRASTVYNNSPNMRATTKCVKDT